MGLKGPVPQVDISNQSGVESRYNNNQIPPCLLLFSSGFATVGHVIAVPFVFSDFLASKTASVPLVQYVPSDQLSTPSTQTTIYSEDQHLQITLAAISLGILRIFSQISPTSSILWVYLF